MKQLFLTLCVALFGMITSYGQPISASSKSDDSKLDACPISVNTKRITYSHHTNSGEAKYTTIILYEDHLTWNYNEARNNCCLEDICKYSKKEFDQLVKKLSTIEFSAVDVNDYSVGGPGYNYSFVSDTKMYFTYGSTYYLTGNHREATLLIQEFIKAHKTKCERLFEKYARKPHERGDFGEFKTLPQKLKKYQVK